MPAAGRGYRLGHELPKALIEISGKPLFIHSVLPFLKLENCVQAVIAVPETHISEYKESAARHLGASACLVVAGGATRQDSVASALAHTDASSELVLIHDAARPLVSRELIERVLSAFDGGFVASVPGLPVTDTIKRAQGNPPIVQETVIRNGLFAVQTPQAILRDVAIQAHKLASTHSIVGTDDVSLVEQFGLGGIAVVEGDPENIKVTTSRDLEHVREVLQAISSHFISY